MKNLPITPENIKKNCLLLGFDFPAPVIAQLGIYLALLMKWNRVMNLVGAKDWQTALSNLLADSFHLARFLGDLPALRNIPEPACLDLGAGAGLPGIPLRMLWQKGSYTLVEIREKRAVFMETVLASAALPGTHVFHGPAEEIFKRLPPVDMIVSRAFLPWEKVLDLVHDHLRPGGICIFSMLVPCPESLPGSWTKAGQYAYKVTDGRIETPRFFWALARA